MIHQRIGCDIVIAGQFGQGQALATFGRGRAVARSFWRHSERDRTRTARARSGRAEVSCNAAGCKSSCAVERTGDPQGVGSLALRNEEIQKTVNVVNVDVVNNMIVTIEALRRNCSATLVLRGTVHCQCYRVEILSACIFCLNVNVTILFFFSCFFFKQSIHLRI
jgi:hypothetical protein